MAVAPVLPGPGPRPRRQLVADGVGVAQRPVLGHASVPDLDHVHRDDLVASSGGCLDAAAGVAVDRDVVGRDGLLDRHGDVAERAGLGGLLPLASPGLSTVVIAGGAASM